MPRYSATGKITTLKEHAVSRDITLHDPEHDVSLELEAKRLGNLGITEITDLLASEK